MGDTQERKTLPLQDFHEAAKARFGAFAGWNMPITYPLGVMKEHLHTREHVGLFDISHMKLIEISGPDTITLLAQLCPLDPSVLKNGQSKYSFFLSHYGGILDDIIVTRLGDDRFIIVANAGNVDADIEHLNEAVSGKTVKIEPLERVFLAIQGPEAQEVVSNLDLPADELSFMTGVEPKEGWFMTRSGYTGEDGFEIGLPIEEGRELVEKLLADERVAWIGLAARDSLRLEAGLCLHGQDITPETDPVSAGLTWAISKPVREKAEFKGAQAVLAAIANGTLAKRVGLKPEGRQPVRTGAELIDENGHQIGTVTSGGFGPTAGCPVAMGYVEKSLASPGTRIFAEIRGNKVPVDVVTLPFIPHRYRKG